MIRSGVREMMLAGHVVEDSEEEEEDDDGRVFISLPIPTIISPPVYCPHGMASMWESAR